MKVASIRVKDYLGAVAETAFYGNDETTTLDLENLRAKLAECLRSKIIEAQRAETLYTAAGSGLVGPLGKVTNALLITLGAGADHITLPFYGPQEACISQDGSLDTENLAVIDLLEWMMAHVVTPLGEAVEFESGRMGLGLTAAEKVIAAATRTRSRGWDGKYHSQHGARIRVV